MFRTNRAGCGSNGHGVALFSGAGSVTTPANQPPATPTISAGTLTSTGATFTGSAFSDPDVGDTHAASQWQVTTAADTSFGSPLYNPGDDATNKTSLVWSGGSASTGYLARVRYKDSAGNYSAWATSASFTTAAGGTTVSAPTRLDFGTDNTAAQPSKSTAVVTPSPTAVTVVRAYTNNTVTPTISGARGTWSPPVRRDNAGVNMTLYCWVGTGTATAQAITIAAASGTWDRILYEVLDCEGGNQTTPLVAANSVGVTHNSTDTVCMIPVAQALGAGNLFLSAFGFNGGGRTGLPRSGWTEVTDQMIASTAWFESQYRQSTDTAASVDLGVTGYNGAGILIEIAHA